MRDSDTFHRADWLAATCGEEKIRRYGVTGSSLRLSLCATRRWGLPCLRLPAFTPVGPLAHPAKRLVDTDRELTALLDQLPTNASIAFKAELTPAQLLAVHRAGFYSAPRLTYRLALHPELRVLDAFNRNRRREVRRAEQRGLRYRSVPPERAHRLFAELLRDRGIRLRPTAAAFARLAPFLGEGGAVRIRGLCDAEREGWAAALMTVRHGDTVYALYNARTAAPTGGGALSLLYRQVIEEWAGEGVTTFDFNGSMLPGVEDYLRGFGGERHLRYFLQRMPGGRLGKLLLGLRG